jgi:hypothetical protein
MGSDGGAAADSGKVARLIDRYGLDGTGDDLVARWTGDGAERSSLRELADWFNRELLRVSMVRAGMNPMDRTVEHHHDALTDTEGSEGHRTEVRNELARAGVDVDALLADFVSHQSVHTYLTRVRGARSPTENTAPRPDDHCRRRRPRTPPHRRPHRPRRVRRPRRPARHLSRLRHRQRRRLPPRGGRLRLRE